LLGDVKRRGHAVGHERRIGERGQIRKVYSTGELVKGISRHVQSQSCLAATAWAGQREQTRRLQQLFDLRDLPLAANEAGALRREVVKPPGRTRRDITRPSGRLSVPFRNRSSCGPLRSATSYSSASPLTNDRGQNLGVAVRRTGAVLLSSRKRSHAEAFMFSFRGRRPNERWRLRHQCTPRRSAWRMVRTVIRAFSSRQVIARGLDDKRT
jgi:hypothetical protein